MLQLGKRTIIRVGAAAAALALSVTMVGTAPAEANPNPYPGAASYPTYNGYFYSGPPIRHLANFVPQGLAYWQAKDDMVISSYNEDGTAGAQHALLTVVDRISRREVKKVEILGGHVGGAAIGAGYLWVADTTDAGSQTVRRYSLAALAAAADGSYLTFDRVFTTKASSYITFHGGDVWVGSFTSSFGTLGTLYRYDVVNGALSTNPVSSIRTPGRTQGVALSGDYVFWSQSYGRTNPSRIRVSTIDGTKTSAFDGPSMTQGLAIADGFLYVNTESGASLYRYGEDGNGRSINPVTELHYAFVSQLKARL